MPLPACTAPSEESQYNTKHPSVVCRLATLVREAVYTYEAGHSTSSTDLTDFTEETTFYAQYA